LKKTSKNENDEENEKYQNSSEDKLSHRDSLISWIVFLFSVSIVLISLVSVVFPALISSSSSTIQDLQEIGVDLFEVEPFQVGIWGWSLLVVNFLVFIGLFLYFKNKLPENFKRLVDFVFTFEISKKISAIVIILLFSIYVGFSFEELTIEEEWEDYPGVKKRLERWSPEQVTSSFEPHIKYFMLWSSMILFGNYSVIP